MAEEPDTRPVRTDMRDWGWLLPAAARQMLDALAQLADTDRLGRGTPLPERHRLRILGGLLHHLFPDDTTARLPETSGSLSEAQRAYLAALVHRARQALDRAQAEAPSTLLGFPPGTRAMWANLLDAGWVPMQPGWIAVRR